MNFSQNCGKKMVAAASAVLLCGSMGLAQAGQQPSSPAGQTPGQNNPAMDSQMNAMNMPGQPSAMDKMFVKKALQGGMAEVHLGQLTLQKSNNDQVKQFAQRMIDDHTKLGEQMKPVAQQLGVPIVPVSLVGSFQHHRTGHWMLWPATVTVVLHDIVETKGLTKEDVPALRDKVRAIISAPLEARLESSG